MFALARFALATSCMKKGDSCTVPFLSSQRRRKEEGEGEEGHGEEGEERNSESNVKGDKMNN